jgi:hypothetical protein
MLKKRIPTIIGLILLIIGAIAGVLFIDQRTNFLPKAAPEYTPQQVKITNITDTGFVVSWVTTEPTIGFVRYGDTAIGLSKTATDDRDQLAGSSGQYRTHYVTIQGLTPSQTYYFKLGSQDEQLYDNNGQPFSIPLPPTLTDSTTTNTAFGTVLTQVDTAAEGAIVYVSIDNASPLSALVKQNGNYAANLSLARTTDFSQYADILIPETTINLLVQSNPTDTTTATTIVGNHQPIPTIIMGQTNNFAPSSVEIPNPTPDITEDSPSPTNDPSVATPPPTSNQSSTFPLYNMVDEGAVGLTITTLPQDGVNIISAQPEISGTAPPNTRLTITVHSPTAITAPLTSDESGNWSWLVPEPLDPGDHTLVISYQDDSGVVQQITRYFTIQAAGLSQVDLAYSATPSASPTPAPTTSPTPTPSASPTPLPTLAPTPSPVPEPTPTPISTATNSAHLVAGTTTTTTAILVIGGLAAAAGLFLLKRHSI